MIRVKRGGSHATHRAAESANPIQRLRATLWSLTLGKASIWLLFGGNRFLPMSKDVIQVDGAAFREHTRRIRLLRREGADSQLPRWRSRLGRGFEMDGSARRPCWDFLLSSLPTVLQGRITSSPWLRSSGVGVCTLARPFPATHHSLIGSQLEQ